jgi:hypothetical protein
MIRLDSIFKEITLFRITLLSVIFFSGGIQNLNIFITTLIPVLLILILYIRNRVGIHLSMVKPIIILLLYFYYALLIAHDADDIKFIGYRIVRFLMAISLVNYIIYKEVDFFEELYEVLKWIALHGIINFFAANFLFKYFHPIPETTSSTFLIFFGTGIDFFYFQRNQGIFWEPGVFQIFLNLFLFINLFFRNKKFPVWIILALIVSTASTTGMVISLLQLLYYSIISAKMNSRKIILFILAAPVLFGYFILTKNIVEDKLVGSSRGSFWSRSFDTFNGLNIALNNPWGIGFSTVKYQDIARNNKYNIDTLIDTDRGQTNSITTLFYSTGILWGMFMLYLLYKQTIFTKQKFLLFGMFIFCLSSEPLFFSTFFLIFPITGMVGLPKLIY